MRVLSLDTTGAVGSFAIVEDDVVVAERSGDPTRSQAEQLPVALTRLLADCGFTLSAVDRFAVAVGPGSFTGIRIGVATIQGLAVVTSRKVVAISALEALAHASSSAGRAADRVAAWIDARRGEVFSALYEVGPGSQFERDRFLHVELPTVSSPQATLSRWNGLGPLASIFVCSGVVQYRELIPPGVPIQEAPALAGIIGRLAVHRREAADLLEPGQIQPLYVRRPDVEKAREALKLAR